MLQALQRLKAAGIELRATGGRLIVRPTNKLTPELRAVIRDAKPQLIAALKQTRSPDGLIDRRNGYESALRTEALVVCLNCYRFSRGGSVWAEGRCALHGDTFALTPFDCPEFIRTSSPPEKTGEMHE